MTFKIYLACSFLLTEVSHGQLLDLREFCSNAMLRESSCNQCRGIPGKRGEKGGPGPKGEKGDSGGRDLKGEPVEKEFLDGLRSRIERLEVLQFDCTLGMKNRAIRDSQITTSSAFNDQHAGRFARLDEQPKSGSVGAWCAKARSTNEWIQVDLRRPTKVFGIVTQGRPVFGTIQHLRSYKISCGNSASTLKTVSENGRDKIFNANNDRDSKVYNWLPVPLTCRYVRLHPYTWKHSICMRMEIMGGDCP